MGWKGEESAVTKSIPSTDLKWVQWLRVARNYQIKVALKDGTKATFDGFSKTVSFIIFPSSSSL
jgi:structure-specific recognition protein 1